MSNLQLPTITGYADALKYVGKRIAYATDMEASGGVVQVLHHGAPIIGYRADGSVSFRLAGWDSATTRHRVSHFLSLAFPGEGISVGRNAGVTRVVTQWGLHALEIDEADTYHMHRATREGLHGVVISSNYGPAYFMGKR